MLTVLQKVGFEMRVPEFILSEFMNHVDQSAYLYFCEMDVKVSSKQASDDFLSFRKLAVILYEWIDNDHFDLKSEYRSVLNANSMLPIIKSTMNTLASGEIEIQTADPHEDVPLFLKQVYECFLKIQKKENQSKAWEDYLSGKDPDFKDIPYSFEHSSDQSCSFCDKTADQVEQIIAGPKAHICNECVGLCNNVLAEEEVEES